MRKRVLVTGANGMLGKSVLEVLGANPGYELTCLVRALDYENPYPQLLADLRDETQVFAALYSVKPDVILHLAAITNLDTCEQDHALADAVHIEGTRLLAAYDPGNTYFVYISTDSVFDGMKGNYTETDLPAPVNYYAKSKYGGELTAAATNRNSLIVRLNIYGLKGGHSLVEWAIKNLQESQQIKGFTDVYFNPLYTYQVAILLNELLGIMPLPTGYLHIGSEKPVSKFDFLTQLASVFGFEHQIMSGSVRDFNFKVPRPNDTTLRVERANRILGYTPQLDDGLAMLHQHYLELLISTKNV